MMYLSFKFFQALEENETYGALDMNSQLFRGGEALYILMRDELFHPFEDERVLVLQNVIVDDHRLEGV